MTKVFSPRARETARLTIRSCCRWILNLLTALRRAQEIRPRFRKCSLQASVIPQIVICTNPVGDI
ncbi:hypothetical protein M758_5G089100 [Ceratodon purpureus]|nr:hypothetical protein M758_5G089100 [Ceratodon purpureus]